eukprot:scaffold19922_cov120-Isochrysis_galbana.AAC.4
MSPTLRSPLNSRKSQLGMGRGGGGKGEQLAQQVPERSYRRTRKRSREGDIGDGDVASAVFSIFIL